MDRADEEEADVQKSTAEELREEIRQLSERKERYDEMKDKMEASGESQISLTDLDSRSMPKSPKVDVGHNVQTAVDDKHKLIVEQDVTNAVTDVDHLSRIATTAKDTLGAGQAMRGTVVGADSGLDASGQEPSDTGPLTFPMALKAQTSLN